MFLLGILDGIVLWGGSFFRYFWNVWFDVMKFMVLLIRSGMFLFNLFMMIFLYYFVLGMCGC